MPLIRGDHYFDNHFTQIPNSWLRDNRITFKARGLLAQILSNSTGFRLSIRSIAENNKEGRDAIRSAVKELEFYGYLEPVGQDAGEYAWKTKDPHRSDNPPSRSENPANSRSDNPTTKNTNKNTKVKNKDFSDEFEEFWSEYPKKVDKAKAFKAFRSALSRAKFEEILAGVIRYKNDPTRKPDFTKYPATWLNADAWANEYEPDRDAESRKKMERERERTQEMLAEMRAAEANAVPAPRCEHGKMALLCSKCCR